jgi:hypothetical protein
MKYLSLRNKKVGDKDLELRDTYKKKRLFEIQERETKAQLHEDDPEAEEDQDIEE